MTTLSNCPNCNTPLDGPFCSSCGQNQKDLKRFFLSLVNEAFDGVFSFDSRAGKTLFALLFRPGLLSIEFFNGRRARYVAPLRLYLVTSVIFFLSLSLANLIEQLPSGGTALTTPSQQGDTAISAKSVKEPRAEKQDNLDEETLDQKMAELDLEFGDGDPDNYGIPLVSDETSKTLTKLFKNQVNKAIEDPNELAGSLLDVAPPLIFILLPVFALLLKLLYITKGLYYSEHLVFSLHMNSFAFLILILFSFYNLLFDRIPYIGSVVGMVLLLWPPIYGWRALKNVYQQSRFLTSVNFIILNISYAVLLSIGLVFALLIGLVTL